MEEEQQPKQPSAELKAIIEALIFASPDPLTPKALYKLLATETQEDVQAAIADLKKDYERPGGLQFVEVAGGFLFKERVAEEGAKVGDGGRRRVVGGAENDE